MEIIRASAAAGILACLWKIPQCHMRWKAIPPHHVCVCAFLAVQDMKMFGSPRGSTCADICLKLSLLFSPAVPHFICLSALGFHADDEGPRRSAMRCGSSPPLFSLLPPPFWHLANYERRSGCLQTLQRVNAKIRCLNSADWNLLLAIFMWLVRHPSWLWLALLSRVLAVTFPTRAAFSLL